MKLTIRSKVKGFSPAEIYSVFDFDLLHKLSPPFLKPEAIIYEGNRPGNQIVFNIKTPMGKKTWMGEITEEGKSETEIYFTDVGIKMPLGLTSWSHTHLLIKKEWGTQIEDRLFFNGLNRLHTWILLPALWIQFIYRKPLYERVIRKRLSDSNIK